MPFVQVAPGVMVNTDSGFQVEIPHPDPCWLIFNSEGIIISNGETGAIPIFTTEEQARTFMHAVAIEAEAKEFTWDAFVDYMDELTEPCTAEAIVDHRGEDGYYSVVPIRKGI